MPAFAHILVFMAYVTISVVGAIGAVRFTTVGVELGAVLALAGVVVCSFLHMLGVTAKRSEQVEEGLLSIRNDIRKLNQRAEILETRVTQLDDTIVREVEERREAIVSEMRELEDLIARLGRSFETRLSEAKQPSDFAPSGRLQGETALRAVQGALRDNRVDLHLQPIVSLPQRRVCFYEGFTRLRDSKGDLIMPRDFLGAAQEAGLLGVIDNMLLFRCVQIVRRLSERDRRVGVFCNVAMSSLEDESFFPQFLDFMRENQDLSGSLIFEIGYRDFLDRSTTVARNMGRLVDLGFRFSLDKASGLGVDLPELQGEGVRFLKVEGSLLLEQLVPGGERPVSSIIRDIQPQDVSAVFSRYGVELIAEKMEDEKTVVEVLDFDIPYGQGHVFGSPRPIKGELLQETAPPEEFLKRAGGAFG